MREKSEVEPCRYRLHVAAIDLEACQDGQRKVIDQRTSSISPMLCSQYLVHAVIHGADIQYRDGGPLLLLPAIILRFP